MKFKTLFLAGLFLLTSHLMAEKQPNIVFLFVDDLGWADINYRQDKFDIPNIKSLMAEGMTFTDAYSSSPTCSPSRASVYTGVHPAQLKIVRHVPHGKPKGEFHQWKNDPAQFPSRNWLPLEETTFAEALKKKGYKNAFVGKWHLGDEAYWPNHQGYDEQYCVSNSGSPRSYYAPYFDKYSKPLKNVPKGQYLTDRLTDKALAFLGKQDGKKPFQLTVSYYSVHSPHIGRKDYVKKMKAKKIKGRELHHAAMLCAVDESLGRIHKTLKEKGLLENTVIFFLGDQGGEFNNRPLRGGKYSESLNEGGARIPFVVSWAKKIRPGSSSKEPVVTTDLFPTMLSMAGGDVKRYANLDGKDITALLKNKSGFKRDQIFLYRSYEDQYAVIRSGQWKLIAYRSGKIELFDLLNDLSERNECSKKFPKKAKELKARLERWEKKVGVSKYNKK